MLRKSLADVWYEDAVLKGERNGEKRRSLELAKRLKALGRMTVDEIAELTGLTVDDILRM